MDRRQFLKVSAVTGASLLVPWKLGAGRAYASTLVPQVPLLGSAIPKWVDPLPHFAGARVTGTNITVSMQEFSQQVLPAGFGQTWVWGYQVGGAPALYPGYTVEATRGTPTTMTYVNNLPTAGSVVQPLLTVDQTLHWADPQGNGMVMTPYSGPPPAVVHLHGGEVLSDYDGGPDQWFTPDGIHGPGYRSAVPGQINAATYVYPNAQEATTLWFHDHTLGATRLNVYAGMAAFYFLRDNRDTGLPNNPIGLPAGNYEIEIVIQDRMFDVNGQWLFPDIGINPEHPFWLPEFLGDTMVVNGKTWPYLEVEPRRYRFRFLNGSNARFYSLRLADPVTQLPGPPLWQIGSDGGLLNAPAQIAFPNELTIGPGERADVIIDFGALPPGTGPTFILYNGARAPFPKGAPANPNTVGQILQFRVVLPLQGTDTSYNPAAPAVPLRDSPIVALNPGGAAVKRQLTLNEVMGMGGPLEVLVNNTKWVGKRPDGSLIPGFVPDLQGNYLSELPTLGTTEVWEIINLTADAHPIHLHLVQFQLLSRQPFQLNKYAKAYGAAFPGGVYQPAYGPPKAYFTANTDNAVGGNPPVGRFLQGAARPPAASEAGWKDTVIMYPGEVTRIAVRFAAQDGNPFPFDATTGPGYVWHCHIVDHEDNEMMRPYIPVP